MKNKFLTQKISLVTLLLLSTGSLFGRTLTVDSKTESDLTSGLVAWYPLDGNASDMSGKSRNGTIYGATETLDRHGKRNSAYSFDGKDDYIKINHDNAFNSLPLTVSSWFMS